MPANPTAADSGKTKCQKLVEKAAFLHTAETSISLYGTEQQLL